MMKRGLTLFEVLVIIGIMGLLAAIILPPVAQYRSDARRAACASNMTQISKAMLMYSDVPSHSCFPTNKAIGRGDPLPSLGILYRDYIADSRVFSCPSKPTVSALADLQSTVGAGPSPSPLNASMTHYGYDPGNKGTNYAPHTPNDTAAIIVSEFTAAGRISDNHGPSAGQNFMRGCGSVEWTDTLVNPVSLHPVVQDNDITADGTLSDPTMGNMKSYISQ